MGLRPYALAYLAFSGLNKNRSPLVDSRLWSKFYAFFGGSTTGMDRQHKLEGSADLPAKSFGAFEDGIFLQLACPLNDGAKRCHATTQRSIYPLMHEQTCQWERNKSRWHSLGSTLPHGARSRPELSHYWDGRISICSQGSVISTR